MTLKVLNKITQKALHHSNVRLAATTTKPNYCQSTDRRLMAMLLTKYLFSQKKNQIYRFKDIIGHQGPLAQSHEDYKGSFYNNLRVEWENGEVTFEPLDIFGCDDPVSCALYGLKNDLINKPVWRWFKRLAIDNDKSRQFENNVKLFASRYGVQVPSNHNDAMSLDKHHGNKLWSDSERIEIEDLEDYDTF
jgi:hypothetical protein